MNNVTEICNPEKIWTLEEANQILPLLIKLSTKTDKIVDQLLQEQRFLMRSNAPKNQIDEVDRAVIKELTKWGSKLVKLGTKVMGGFILFNTDGGYYSYVKGEPKVEYFSFYSEPIANRRKV